MKIIENIKENISGSIYLVIGGFHLIRKHKKTVSSVIEKVKQHNIKMVAPSHCTGKNAIKMFKEAYGKHFLEVKVGKSLKV